MKAARTLRVASVQMESLPANKEANFEKIERFAAKAAAAGARLVVFPECCVSGYWFIRNLTPEALASLAGYG
jgi:predicted amidohydrolase